MTPAAGKAHGWKSPKNETDGQILHSTTANYRIYQVKAFLSGAGLWGSSG